MDGTSAKWREKKNEVLLSCTLMICSVVLTHMKGGARTKNGTTQHLRRHRNGCQRPFQLPSGVHIASCRYTHRMVRTRRKENLDTDKASAILLHSHPQRVLGPLS
jgi:hypothetical protein